MAYSIGVEYALHCLVNLVNPPVQQPIAIKDLAEFQGVSVTYLSKIFTKLTKANIIQSTPGIKGGYELKRAPEDISFFDVVEAIEGRQPIFKCRNIKEKGLIPEFANEPTHHIPCRINLTMLEAERKMEDYLKQKTLLWLKETLDREFAPEILEKKQEWYMSLMNK
ncbi:RrF2 family transcriptional regulator [Shimazuella alba]|jgi:Rrf2 family protein|uniref:Rrf2 family transcriptional regulator n=1 Tax=Shimazuella alba TaxID=2690964 RepID=A0A6I4VRD1_9BACL|nr:Rrf2 family transcriptional regulator [Shimazuella alba]MXQ54209.1 Rrf2 family transcriptional regulator [Shimazuella alba]